MANIPMFLTSANILCFLFALYVLIPTFAYMSTKIERTTITIKPEVKKQAAKYAKKTAVRGGLSGYIEILLREDLAKKGIDV